MMIRALLRKQLRELGAAFLRSSKTGKARSRASAVGYALLFAVLVVVLMLCFAGMALPLASVLLPAGLDWLYFASMGLTALLVSVLASAFTSYSGLFQSRDNELLLSLAHPAGGHFRGAGEHRLSGLPDLPAHGVGLRRWCVTACWQPIRWPGCCAASPWHWCWPERPAFWRYCWAGPWRWPMTAPGTKVWSPWCARMMFFALY